MENLKAQMFWYKYRPKSLASIILLPRIRELVKDGLKMNMVFYSDSAGTGKSSLARILCKNTDNIEFDASQDTSIEILRNQLTKHCKSLNPFVEKGSLKTILLDEFDGVSPEYKKAMKGFSDRYQHVRFILTTNYIEEIGDKIISRFTKVDFTPKNKEEVEYLQGQYLLYLKAIASKNELIISNDELKKVVLLSFPDLRSAVQKVQEIILSKDKSQLKDITASSYEDIFTFVLDGKNNIEENYHFVMSNFQDNPLELMKALGRPLFSRLMVTENVELMKKGATLINLQKIYSERYNETIDPIIHLISYITDIKDIFKK